MSGVSPSSVLFGSDGTELAVVSGSAVPSGTRAILTSGVDGYTGQARYIPATELGALGITQMSSTFSVLNNITINASGSQLITFNNFGTQGIALVVNTGTVTGVGNITFTIQEVDPGDGTTVYGSSASTAAISSGNAPGVFTAVLNTTTSTKVRVAWTVAGGAFSASIYATVVSKATPAIQTITGSISAVNDSVGANDAASLGFDTQVGGIVHTAAPTYTNGNLSALSLTTLGGLRIDGVYAGATATSTATNQMVSGAYVTTAAPSYTNNTLNALSLTTAGALRVDGSATTQPVSGTVTANQGTSPWIVAGGGTAGSPASGVVTVQGISSMTPLEVRTNKTASSSVTGVAISANSNNTILASNANRIAATIFNNTGKTLYIKLGATASTSSFTTQLFNQSYWEVPNNYTGIIDAFAPAGASGTALVTELTP